MGNWGYNCAYTSIYNWMRGHLVAGGWNLEPLLKGI